MKVPVFRDILNYSNWQDIEADEWLEADADRGRVRRNRVYRRLIMSPVVYNEGVEDSDYAYIKNYKNMILKDMEEHLEASLHVHKNGALLVFDSPRQEMDVFPGNGTLSDIVLQVNSEIVSMLKADKLSRHEDDIIQIYECVTGLSEIPGRIEIAIRASQTNKEHYNSSLIAIDKVQKQLERYKKIVEMCSGTFAEEYKLGYVQQFEGLLSNIATAKKVLAEFKGEEKSNKFREEYTSQLHDKFRENAQYLVEYNLRIDTIFNNQIDEEDSEDMTIARLYSLRRRSELCAKVQGKDTDFFAMTGFISDAIEENEKLLRESDRRLFEDILANTVGKKIRGKIYQSEMWVKKINALMESMDTSSGLSFSLSWRNKVAENEDQLGTRDLVHLLQIDAVLLTEEDMGKLTAHFRSKISQARKSIEETGAQQSFHTIMKEILDYRKWFEFQLFYKKTNELRKELTENAFYKFSGGEKAMAMYVPLFSSVYARFDGARTDCPRVISLDKAFAGVDENNIRDMFRLVDELGLDYVINSQVLWGDYDTVPALSIYELLRPNNADFVTTIRYNWNGKKKSLILEDEEIA